MIGPRIEQFVRVRVITVAGRIGDIRLHDRIRIHDLGYTDQEIECSTLAVVDRTIGGMVASLVPASPNANVRFLSAVHVRASTDNAREM